jgi:hypothetical protein
MKQAPIQIALATLIEATAETEISINIAEGGIHIYWHGVTELKTDNPNVAAKAIVLMKQLNRLA